MPNSNKNQTSDNCAPSTYKQLLSTMVASDTAKQLLPALIASEADVILHPVDTLIKHAQNTIGKINNTDKYSSMVLGNVKESNSPISYSKHFKTLLNGFWWSAFNKGVTRTYRFLTQTFFQKKIESQLNPFVKKYLNEHQSKTLSGFLAGAAAATSETFIFHPLDTVKTRAQLREPIRIRGLYQGVGPALLRNTASGTLFFGTYQSLINLAPKKNPTIENLAATIGAGLVSTVVTNPLDVIKTRLQANTNQSLPKVGIFALGKRIFKTEGASALAKGLFWKSLQSPFKGALPYFVYKQAQQLVSNANEEKLAIASCKK